MSQPPVIITRAQPGATATAAHLAEMGIGSIVSPALNLQLKKPVPEIPLLGASGVLFTSANGVRFFSEVSADRSLQAWCVGPSTAAAARDAGFAIVHNADGNSEDLAELVIAWSNPKSGHFVHVANTAAGSILRDRLLDAGFEIEFVGLYEPVEAVRLSPAAEDALRADAAVCVLIHSAKGASSFAKLCAEFEGVQITFICVSDKAAEPIKRLGHVRVADRPNETALLSLVRDWHRTL